MGRSHSRRSCRRTPLTSESWGSCWFRTRGFSEVATRPTRSVLQQPARNPVSHKPLPRSEISEGGGCPARFRCFPSEGSARPLRFCCAGSEGSDCPARFRCFPSEGSARPLRFRCADSEGRRCPLRFWPLPLKGRYGISQGRGCPLSPADKIWEGNGCPLRFSRAKSEGGDGTGSRQARGAQPRRGEPLGALSQSQGCADASEGHGRRSSCRSSDGLAAGFESGAEAAVDAAGSSG